MRRPRPGGYFRHTVYHMVDNEYKRKQRQKANGQQQNSGCVAESVGIILVVGLVVFVILFFSALSQR